MMEGQRWLIGSTLSPGQGHLGLRKCQGLGSQFSGKRLPKHTHDPKFDPRRWKAKSKAWNKPSECSTYRQEQKQDSSPMRKSFPAVGTGYPNEENDWSKSEATESLHGRLGKEESDPV